MFGVYFPYQEMHMSEITLKEISLENLRDVSKLTETLTLDQQQCVAPNAFSIAEGLLTGADAWFKAVCLGETPIGFVMVHTGTDDWDPDEYPGVYLWRFMIAGPYQHKGYGTQVLDMLVSKFREEERKVMYTSCVMGSSSPYDFYISYGFTDTLEQEEGEQVLKLILQ